MGNNFNKEIGETARQPVISAEKVLIKGEEETGETVRTISGDIRETLVTGEKELGETSRQFILSGEKVIIKGEEETGETVRVISGDIRQTITGFVEEQGKTIDIGIIGITGVLIGLLGLVGYVMTNEEVNKTYRVIPESIIDGAKETATNLGDNVENMTKNITTLLEKQPQIAKNVENITDSITSAIPTKSVTTLADNIKE